ncbi:MAG: 4-(cytidine 5'-diphospho)-2-C-methyl-D-erythritol kinase [Oscillospiraceae bacterium]|nr:4-(cytidine 5'-diphospho)-2-C-methyl-D-erythritol kinase [Oscillospiraceae bacterium]
MESVSYRAYAKLNLSLDVTGKREDGYHLMDMVNVSVSLCDSMIFTRTPGRPFSISSTVRFLPTGEKNLVWKAANALFASCGKELPEMHIHIIKRIPTQAGLGGGSADAACALIALNKEYELGMSVDDLCSLAEKIGADVPFCVRGGYARVTGIGEEITAFESPSKYHLVLVMPKQGKSTKAVFEAIDNAPMLNHPDNDAVVSWLKKGKPDQAMKNAENVFETSIPDEETIKLTDFLKESGAYYSALTGTGACVFGMFSKYSAAIKCRDLLRDQGYGCWTALPVSAGVEQI